MPNPNLKLLVDAARLLTPILDELVFVGGCTTALLLAVVDGREELAGEIQTAKKRCSILSQQRDPTIGRYARLSGCSSGTSSARPGEPRANHNRHGKTTKYRWRIVGPTPMVIAFFRWMARRESHDSTGARVLQPAPARNLILPNNSSFVSNVLFFG
jgi:hypothetical protein